MTVGVQAICDVKRHPRWNPDEHPRCPACQRSDEQFRAFWHRFARPFLFLWEKVNRFLKETQEPEMGMTQGEYTALLADLEWMKQHHPEREAIINFAEKFRVFVSAEHQKMQKAGNEDCLAGSNNGSCIR